MSSVAPKVAPNVAPNFAPWHGPWKECWICSMIMDDEEPTTMIHNGHQEICENCNATSEAVYANLDEVFFKGMQVLIDKYAFMRQNCVNIRNGKALDAAFVQDLIKASKAEGPFRKFLKY